MSYNPLIYPYIGCTQVEFEDMYLLIHIRVSPEMHLCKKKSKFMKSYEDASSGAFYS